MELLTDIYAHIWRKRGIYVVVGATLGAVLAYQIPEWWAARKERQLFAVHTAMDDLDTLGKRSKKQKLPGTAVIVGGSMTGLITARICADHFDHVVIIEADEGADTQYPAASKRRDAHGNMTFVSRRPRVAQSFGLHLYRPFALLALRRLFSDFDKRFTATGGIIKPWTYNTFWSGIKIGLPSSNYLGGQGLPKHHNLPREDVPDTIWITRANFEVFLRKQVLESCDNIDLVYGTVMGLYEQEKGRINSVRYSVKGESGLKEQEAALVVDCTGHSKAGVKWMKQLGYGPIPQESYDPQLRYATIWFDIDDDQITKLPIPDHLKDMAFYLFSFEDPALGNRLFWVSRIEGNKVGLSFGGFGITSEELPRTAEELKDFYRSIKTRTGKPMDEWYCTLTDFLSQNGGWERAAYEEGKVPPCVFVKYHKVPLLPSNFVALGDAAMRPSPVYGFGVTKGMVGAVTLAGVLDRVRGPTLPKWFGKEVMHAQNTRTEWSWTQAKEADYGYPTTIPCVGETLEVGAATREISKAFFGLTAEDEETSARYYYHRLWIYPSSVMLSQRVLDMCRSRIKEKTEL